MNNIYLRLVTTSSACFALMACAGSPIGYGYGVSGGGDEESDEEATAPSEEVPPLVIANVTPTPTPTPAPTPTPTPAPTPTPTPTPTQTQTEFEEPIQLTRYIGGDASDWQKTGYSSSRLNSSTGYADLYTRFVLYGDDNPGPSNGEQGASEEVNRNLRNYRAERPSWVSRLFSREERSVVAVARVSVLNPGLEMTIPLYSMSYNSGGEGGESWATAYTSSYVRSPLFRITGNSRMSVNVKTSTSDTAQSSGFSTAISSITSAVGLVSPEAGILTTLSEQSTKDRATALDSAISDLLSYSISEEIEFGRLLSAWNKDARIDFHGCAPFVRGDDDASRGTPRSGIRSRADNSPCADARDLDGRQNRYVGTWTLQMTCPRFSVFSPRTLCTNTDAGFEDISTVAKRRLINGEIAATVANSLVLEEQLGENSTVRSVIRGSDFFIAFVDDDTKDPTDYGKFCAATMDVLRQTGLSGLDAGLGLRATLKLMPEFVADSSDATKMAVCTQLLGSQGLSL